MFNYKLSKSAVRDLNNIWSYTFKKWSLNQADKYYDSLIRVFKDIADNPNAGKNYKGVSNEQFGFQIGKHIVFYEVLDDSLIEINRILHERMDLEKKLKK